MTSHTTARIYAHTSIFDNSIKPMKYHPLLNSNDYKNNYILLAWSYLVTIKRGVVVTLLFKFWIKFTTIAINWSKVNADSNIKSTLLIFFKLSIHDALFEYKSLFPTKYYWIIDETLNAFFNPFYSPNFA